MRLVALYSGGKDSNYAIYKALRQGHEVSLLISIIAKEDSMLFHHPNIEHTKLQARCMDIPIIHKEGDDLDTLRKALRFAKDRFRIEGVLSGSIASRYQRDRFEMLSKELSLAYITPLWNIDQERYMHDLIFHGFKVIITSVSAYGLDSRWLGRVLSKEDVDELIELSKRYGFNPAFEGGEAETFVLDAPFFKKYLKVIKARASYNPSSYRGFYILEKLSIIPKA